MSRILDEWKGKLVKFQLEKSSKWFAGILKDYDDTGIYISSELYSGYYFWDKITTIAPMFEEVLIPGKIKPLELVKKLTIVPDVIESKQPSLEPVIKESLRNETKVTQETKSTQPKNPRLWTCRFTKLSKWKKVLVVIIIGIIIVGLILLIPGDLIAKIISLNLTVPINSTNSTK